MKKKDLAVLHEAVSIVTPTKKNRKSDIVMFSITERVRVTTIPLLLQTARAYGSAVLSFTAPTLAVPYDRVWIQGPTQDAKVEQTWRTTPGAQVHRNAIDFVIDSTCTTVRLEFSLRAAEVLAAIAADSDSDLDVYVDGTTLTVNGLSSTVLMDTSGLVALSNPV